MSNIKVALPSVHMAGSNAHHDAHIEVGPHGFALFLAPDAEYPVLDVNGRPEELDIVVRDLQAALAVRRVSNVDDVHAVVTAGRDSSRQGILRGVKDSKRGDGIRGMTGGTL